MNRDEYLKLHASLCKEALELSARKNHDYAGKGGEQPFANFERCEAMGICTTGQGFLVRMTDKLSRLASFEQAGEFKVKDESVKDTVLDIVNYAVLYYAQKQSRLNQAPSPAPKQREDRYYGYSADDHTGIPVGRVLADCGCERCERTRLDLPGTFLTWRRG